MGHHEIVREWSASMPGLLEILFSNNVISVLETSATEYKESSMFVLLILGIALSTISLDISKTRYRILARAEPEPSKDGEGELSPPTTYAHDDRYIVLKQQTRNVAILIFDS